MSVWAHRLAEGDQVEREAGPHTRNEFDRLFASLQPVLDKFDVDPVDRNTGEVLYGQLGMTSAIQIQNTFNFPALSAELGSDTNTFDTEDAVLLQLRPNLANRAIHGLKAPAGPNLTPLLIVFNDDETYDLTLSHDSSSATDVRDRMILAGASDLVLAGGDARSAWFTYSHILNRWVHINVSEPSPFVTSETETEVVNSNTLTTVYTRSVTAPVKVRLFGLMKNKAASAVSSATIYVQVDFGGTVIADDVNTILTGVGKSDTLFRLIIIDVMIIGQDAMCLLWAGAALAQAAWGAQTVRNAFYEAGDLSTSAATLNIGIRFNTADAELSFRTLGVALVEM